MVKLPPEALLRDATPRCKRDDADGASDGMWAECPTGGTLRREHTAFEAIFHETRARIRMGGEKPEHGQEMVWPAARRTGHAQVQTLAPARRLVSGALDGARQVRRVLLRGKRDP